MFGRPGLALAWVALLAATGGRLPAQDEEGEKEIVALHRKAQAFKEEGKPAEAARLYERAVEKARALYGADHPATATLMNNLAYLYQALGQYARAEPLYQRSLAIREARLGKDHPDVATSLNNLAELYRVTGQHARAEPLYQRSLGIREAQLGKDHPDVAQSLNNLALLYQTKSQYARAEPLLKRSLEIKEARLGKDHPSVALSLNNLAEVYRVTGQFARAEPLYQRSLGIREAQLGKDHPEVAQSLNNLALLYQAKGQFARAEPLLRRSLGIRETRLGKDHPAVATSLNNLALLYDRLGQYAKAEPLYRRSLAITEAQLGKDHPHVAQSLNNLALLYRDTGRYAKAEPLYRRSLEIFESRLGKDHPEVAQSLSNLALLYEDTGQYTRAEPLFKRSLEIKEAKLGKDHPDVALVLNNLAVLYRDTGQYARAEPLLRRSLEIREARLGQDHPDVALALHNLALLYEGSDRTREAAGLLDRARRASRRHIALVLPALSEREQAAFLQTQDEAHLQSALSLGLRHAGDTALAARSAAWLANGKGVAHEALALTALLARDSKDPSLATLARRLLQVRQQLAGLTFAAPRPGQDRDRKRQLEALATREEELAKELRRAGSAAAAPADWVGPDDLRRRLPPDAALIDVARFEVFDFKARPGHRWGPARYAAWVTPAGGDVRVIDLGPADPIDAAVAAVRRALADAPQLIKRQGEPQAEQALRTPLEALSKLVLHPLLPHVGKSGRWVVSPDAGLWLVPWEALTLPGGKYAVEEHRISYVISGRDLAGGGAGARAEMSRPLVLADPDFDLSPGQALAQARRLLPGRQPDEQVRGLSRSLLRGGATRLPGTAAEARALAPRLKGYAGSEPRLYLGEQALEGVFKATRSPRVVVLCTHGFFLSEEKPPLSEVFRFLSLDGGLAPLKDWENPLLRCGLLLAGCNRAGDVEEGGDDGVLTGLEVVGTDLRGCELVVLSACETGLGDVRQGEGVAGLRQAFQLAGAQSVVATLWQVPDRQSALLMTRFFDNLAAGQARAEALRNAQLSVIEQRRERNAAAHPFFWAAFTLTGDPRPASNTIILSSRAPASSASLPPGEDRQPIVTRGLSTRPEASVADASPTVGLPTTPSRSPEPMGRGTAQSAPGAGRGESDVPPAGARVPLLAYWTALGLVLLLLAGCGWGWRRRRQRQPPRWQRAPAVRPSQEQVNEAYLYAGQLLLQHLPEAEVEQALVHQGWAPAAAAAIVADVRNTLPPRNGGS
jgi:tetratricopeptide (TPR) repeat protein